MQPARHTKLEKADILEMAVKHLQNVQRQQLALAMATDSSVLRKFKTGFNECATEIDRYMNQIDGVDNAMKQRVASHLQKCINGMEQVAQLNFPGFSSMPFLSGGTSFTAPTNQTQLETSNNVGDQNNNPRIQIPQGIQLIPSRLPSGELALLLPNSNNLPYFPSTVTATLQNRPSAFAAVVPQSTSTQSTISKTISPSVSPTNIDRPRNPSPHGFRPVIPIGKPKTLNEDHQVPQISSTSLSAEKQFSQPLEVKTLKFPINRKVESPKKLSEALCVITNQNERYKQAQMKEDSASYPENIVQQGLKRKFSEVHGLLTFASNDTSYAPAPKIMRTQYVNPSSSFIRDSEAERKPEASSLNQKEDSSKKEQSSNNPESNSDMWRPW